MPFAGGAKAPPPREETDSRASDTGRTGSSAPTKQNRNRAKRDVEDAVPYEITRGVCKGAGRGVRPYKAEQEPCETGRRGRRPLHTLSLRGAKRRGNPFSPSPKRRIPAPVTVSLARNDSAPRWERRDTWVPPYGVRRSSRADRGVRPYKAEQEPCETGRRGRRPLRNHKGCVQRGGRRRPPLQSRTGAARSGTAGTACPTNRRRAARTAKFRNFFLPPVRFGGAAAFI